MSSKQSILVFFVCVLVRTVIFRFEPPQQEELGKNKLFSQNPNLVRKRFRNEASPQLSPTPLCSNYDYKNDFCLQCLEGFILLKNKTCGVDPSFNVKKTQSNVQFMRVQNPHQMSQEKSNIMLNRNPFCLDMTSDGLICLTCHKGFILDDGQCIEDENSLSLSQQLYLRPMQVPKNTFCKTFNSEGVCETCFPDSVFNGSECIMIPKHRLDCRLHQYCAPEISDCQTYSSEGVCKSCSRESINVNGICRINKLQSLCERVNKQGKCEKCSKYGSLAGNGTCIYKSVYCVEFNADGTCDVCLPTYRRWNGDCIRPAKIMFINNDPNCATWKQGTCIQCQFGFGFYKDYCMNLDDLRAAGKTPKQPNVQTP